MIKKILFFLIIIAVGLTFFYYRQEIVVFVGDFFKEEKRITPEFVECLKEQGVIIYGSSACPACMRLEKEYGGLSIIKPIYLDCSGLGEEWETEKCSQEMQTSFSPEIQIKGVIWSGWGSPQALAQETGCDI